MDFHIKHQKKCGLDNEWDAFFVTKQAIYSVLDGRDVNRYTGRNAKGDNMVNVLKSLVNIGRNGTQTYTDPVITANAVNTAGVDNKNNNYVSQTFYIDSTVDMKELSLILNTSSAPAGTFIADTNNNPKTTFNKGEQFKILVPRANIKSDIDVRVTADGYCESFPILFGSAPSNTLQDYCLTTDPYIFKTTTINMRYHPTGEIIIIKEAGGDSEITGKKKGDPLEGATFKTTALAGGGYTNTSKTNNKGEIRLTVDLNKYRVEETESAKYYLIGKEGAIYDVDIDHDGKSITIVVDNIPVKLETNVEKGADKEEAQGRELLTYSISNIENRSNVDLSEFTLKDDLPSQVRIEKLTTGTYNYDFKYSVTYTTNKNSTQKVIKDNISSKEDTEIDFTALNLATDEYVTSFSFNYGIGKVGFRDTKPITVTTKVIEGLPDKSTFENNVSISGKYIDITTEDEDNEITKVYENILKVLKVSKEYNQYTDEQAGTPLANTVYDILDENKEYVTTVKTDEQGRVEYKYLPTGKQFFLKEISVKPYFVVNEDLIPFKFEKNGEIIELKLENDNVNLVIDVEKEGPAETQKGQVIKYDFANVGNFSNINVSNFIWGDKLPRQVRIQTITTGIWNEALNYKIEYITNKNTNWKTLAENVSTSESTTFDVTSGKLNLEQDEYVKEFRFKFGGVQRGFREVEKPNITVKVNDDLQNNQIFVNRTYVTAQYEKTNLIAEDEVHTIIYTKTIPTDKELPKTGLDN